MCSKESPILGFKQDSTARFSSAIKEAFSPEFRNRLDAIIAFNALSPKEILKIVEKNITDLNQQIKAKGIEIVLEKSAKEYLAEVGFNAELGARPLALVIQKEIKNPMSDLMLFGDLEKGGKIFFEYKNKQLIYHSQKPQKTIAKKTKKSTKGKE